MLILFIRSIVLGFYFGDAADIATLEWLSFAKQASIRSALLIVLQWCLTSSYDRLAIMLCSKFVFFSSYM